MRISPRQLLMWEEPGKIKKTLPNLLGERKRLRLLMFIPISVFFLLTCLSNENIYSDYKLVSIETIFVLGIAFLLVVLLYIFMISRFGGSTVRIFENCLPRTADSSIHSLDWDICEGFFYKTISDNMVLTFVYGKDESLRVIIPDRDTLTAVYDVMEELGIREIPSPETV